MSLSVFQGHPNLELFWVMVIVPFTLNALQYWIQDNFLKGTEYIQEQKEKAIENRNDIDDILHYKDGMYDFKKNREEYRKRMGWGDREMEARNIQDKDIVDDFVIVEKSINSGKRKSLVIRQMEEANLGIKEDDYDKDGQLDLSKFEKRKSLN